MDFRIWMPNGAWQDPPELDLSPSVRQLLILDLIYMIHISQTLDYYSHRSIHPILPLVYQLF
ncbi:uncharacterized protein MELLADRAFT_85297 [Melampsora larici-populina 98AG31]|uniref:Uncharacterized protein n=1 Tax=Melampsora larici-populina (strain 98AG31 / pathotype 3-4-7) TaxID=747676 RepID=F4RI97_MELLP|nr:uncharacterized protein MELLADRAFT_85297 [Melampsora larici-populina 98AG31]EGG07970.1 hypothetical protein MELLADRAFT_85297 [Melampsora larici-populina 98AG31]